MSEHAPSITTDIENIDSTNSSLKVELDAAGETARSALKLRDIAHHALTSA